MMYQIIYTYKPPKKLLPSFYRDCCEASNTSQELSKRKPKLNKTAEWTPKTEKTFEACREVLAKAAFLSYPKEDAPLALTSD